MNAGAHGTETVDVLVHADVMNLASRQRQRRAASDLAFGYRRSGLGPADVVEAAVFRLAHCDADRLDADMREIVRWRRANQPGGQPNAGSVFRNPDGDSAGRLIEAAGAKGWREGGAEVSPKHANFFVAHPGATASDVARLIVRVRQAVAERFGVTLHPEVRLVGEYPEEVSTALSRDVA